MSSGDNGDIDLSGILFHPEVELRMKVLGNEWGYPDQELFTSLDILEIYPGGKVVIRKDMGDAGFAEYCSTNVSPDIILCTIQNSTS
jgi:hypothetical protein